MHVSPRTHHRSCWPSAAASRPIEGASAPLGPGARQVPALLPERVTAVMQRRAARPAEEGLNDMVGQRREGTGALRPAFGKVNEGRPTGTHFSHSSGREAAPRTPAPLHPRPATPRPGRPDTRCVPLVAKRAFPPLLRPLLRMQTAGLVARPFFDGGGPLFRDRKRAQARTALRSDTPQAMGDSSISLAGPSTARSALPLPRPETRETKSGPRGRPPPPRNKGLLPARVLRAPVAPPLPPPPLQANVPALSLPALAF